MAQHYSITVENKACHIFHCDCGEEGWDFPVPTEHQCMILVRSHILYIRQCTVVFFEVTDDTAEVCK